MGSAAILSVCVRMYTHMLSVDWLILAPIFFISVLPRRPYRPTHTLSRRVFMDVVTLLLYTVAYLSAVISAYSLTDTAPRMWLLTFHARLVLVLAVMGFYDCKWGDAHMGRL